jgi:hypothetical protein
MLDEDGQGNAFAGFGHAAARAVVLLAANGEAEVVQVVVVADCGRVLDPARARAAVEASAHAGVRLAMPEATIRPGAVRVHLLDGAMPKGAAGLAVGAVVAALRSAADQAMGGDAEVLPIPGVSWRSSTVVLRPEGGMPLSYPGERDAGPGTSGPGRRQDSAADPDAVPGRAPDGAS